MLSFGKMRFVAALSALFVAITLVSVDFAEARRGGSFGSRGTRTFQSAPPTRTAPNPAGPVERSMTPNPGTNSPAARQNQTATQRPSLFSPGGLMRGLLIGGLFGMLLGYGFGGMAGALGFILQLLLLLMLVSFAMRFFRSRQEPVAAGGPSPDRGADFGRNVMKRDEAQPSGKAGAFTIPGFGGNANAASAAETRDIRVDQADLDTFERRLAEVQKAFADEDHAALRRLSTPEMVSFFSEELADNAKRGLRNDVRDVHLVQADIAESWNEGVEDYATAAFRYESFDVMRDRNTGEIVEGQDVSTETVELWTFVRRKGGDWKLSAIQEVADGEL